MAVKERVGQKRGRLRKFLRDRLEEGEFDSVIKKRGGGDGKIFSKYTFGILTRVARNGIIML